MAYRDRYDLRPLRIRAHLRTGVVADAFLPLDGILLYQAHRWQCGHQDATIPGDYSSQMKIATLPLGITHPGRRNWYYNCSWAQWSDDVEDKDYWNKRFRAGISDLVDFGNRRGKVIVEQGKYKAYHMLIFVRFARWIDWFCVGDKGEIEALLSTVTHIGKKRAQGWGRVYRWDVEEWDEDWSVWCDGLLMRGIPAEDVAGIDAEFRIANYGIRPSYWKRSNQKPLAMPL